MRLAAVAAVAAAVSLAGAAVGCHPGRPRIPRADAADAPYDLADDEDRAAERDRLDALPPDAAERRELRAALATAVAARLDDELERHRLRRAQRYAFELVSLWRDDPAQLAVEGAALVPTLTRARAAFARAGVDDGALLALAALVELDPAGRAGWQAEIDEVIEFADDLARAEGGADAIRARSIPLLAPIVAALPARWLVDRYVELVAARQRAVNELLAHNGATIELVQAHHDVLDAAHQITGALARAGRLDDAITLIGGLSGLGVERPMAAAVAAVGINRRRPEPYRTLAAQLRDGRSEDDSADDDPGAALAVCTAGLAVRPRDPMLLACAAEHAAADGRILLAMRLLEQDFADGAEDADAAGELAALYRDRIGQLGFAGRLRAARDARVRLDGFIDGIKGRVPTSLLLGWTRDGDVVLARALVSQGHIDEATDILEDVAARSPTVEALEALATIEADRGHHAEARRALEQAIALGGDGIGDELIRGRLHRLAGEAARKGGDDTAAARHYVAALSIWATLTGDETARIELPPAVNGLRLVESGRALWAIGAPAKAIDVLNAALTVDADGEDTYIQVVAFLLMNQRLGEAASAFQRALASEQISDESKVYMALWLIGEQRAGGEPVDTAAIEYLETRRGGAWFDELARAATGRIELTALARTARSPTERAELAFYTATLSLGAPPPKRVRELLEQVVASDLILVYEREIARRRLSAP